MYLRTPKRYKPRRRRLLHLISWRTIILLGLIGGGLWLAQFIWTNRGDFRAEVAERFDSMAAGVQTQVAPQPTPTPTPNLAGAESICMAYRQGHRVNIHDALQECRKLAENQPNNVELHYHVTFMMVITSMGADDTQLQEAVAFSEKAINADPEKPHGWAARAFALDWSGNYGEALAAALHAKALDEDFGPTYAFLGEVYFDLGQTDIAEGYLDKAIELDTAGLAVSHAFRTKGLLAENRGYYEDAVQQYEVALKQTPNHTYIALDLARNYNTLGQADQAIQALGQTLELNPNDASLLWAMGYSNLRNGDRGRAYEYYRQCLDVEPQNVSCLSYLGGLQILDGDYVSAITNLERAIELGSTDPADYLELGRAYIAQDLCDRAVPYLQRGYRITVERELFDQQSKFANALQSCGVMVEQ